MCLALVAAVVRGRLANTNPCFSKKNVGLFKRYTRSYLLIIRCAIVPPHEGAMLCLPVIAVVIRDLST